MDRGVRTHIMERVDGLTIILLRHAEKPYGARPPFGVLPDGTPDSRSLTVQGWVRAGGLVRLLNPATGHPAYGLPRPSAIYAAAAGESESRRSEQTVTPLAESLGLPLDVSYAEGDEGRLVGDLLARGGTPLVAWHHDTLPHILAALGPFDVQPPSEWPVSRFDLIWVVTRGPDGCQFRQVPQLLLAKDLPVEA